MVHTGAVCCCSVPALIIPPLRYRNCYARHADPKDAGSNTDRGRRNFRSGRRAPCPYHVLARTTPAIIINLRDIAGVAQFVCFPCDHRAVAGCSHIGLPPSREALMDACTTSRTRPPTTRQVSRERCKFVTLTTRGTFFSFISPR